MIAKTKRLKYSIFRIREDNVLSISIKNGNVSKDGNEFMFNNIMLVPREARALRDFLNMCDLGKMKPCRTNDGDVYRMCDYTCGHVGTWDTCKYGKLHGRAKR